MKFFKKNQILIYVIALMLVAAGYLNYSAQGENIEEAIKTNVETKEPGETREKEEKEEKKEIAKTNNIGDAQLVNASEKIETEEIEKNEEIEQTNTKPEENYFTKSKLERDTMYSQMLETYEKVLNGINSLETQKQSAAEEIKKINDTKNSIMICENLIATKGFEKVVIFVNGESVSAIIGAEEIKEEELAQLQNILSRELNAKIENIHIATK